jgi:hypothetical protein
VLDLPVSYCFPVCLACGEAGVCARAGELQPVKAVRKRAPWAPNRLENDTLGCGHTDIPWPVVKVLGSDVSSVWCELCGKWVDYREGSKVKRVKKVKGQVKGQEVIPF